MSRLLRVNWEYQPFKRISQSLVRNSQKDLLILYHYFLDISSCESASYSPFCWCSSTSSYTHYPNSFWSWYFTCDHAPASNPSPLCICRIHIKMLYHVHRSYIIHTNGAVWRPVFSFCSSPPNWLFASWILSLKMCPHLNITKKMKVNSVPKISRINPAYWLPTLWKNCDAKRGATPPECSALILVQQ